MGHSRLVADRMLLDLKALVLSLKFLQLAIKNKRSDDADALIASIKKDINKINRAPNLIESFEIIYHSYDAIKAISDILELIEQKNLNEASKKIDALSNKLGAESRESFASSTSYPEIMPLGF